MRTQQFKNKKINTMQCLLALMLTSAAAVSFAGGPTPIAITVEGTIKPGVCTPELTNKGKFVFPDIYAGMLDANSYTPLTPITTDLKIDCTGAPSAFYMTATDNAASSVLSEAAAPAWSAGESYGLGMTSGTQKKIGVYALSVGAATIDNNSTTLSQAIGSTDSGASWSALSNNGNIATNKKITWANPGATLLSPVAFTSLKSTMTVTAILNNNTELALTSDAKLVGNVTLQFSYL